MQEPGTERSISVPLEEKGLTSVSAQTTGIVIQNMGGGLPPVPAQPTAAGDSSGTPSGGE